jgi:hypothetical protein
MTERVWNRCDWCGRFIGMSDFGDGKAVRRMVSEDTEFSSEEYQTKCAACHHQVKPSEQLECER